MRKKLEKHGMYGTRPYNIYGGIKRRCLNKNDISYERYGAKGIKMCDRWMNSFIAFWNDMKEGYFAEAQIDRIDNSKGYYKENCRWATLKEQANNKSSVELYEYDGKKMSMSAWDEELGLKRGAIRNRIKRLGWSIEKALSSKKTKYKGYCYDKSKNDYMVEVRIRGIKYYVGRFKTEKEAIVGRENFYKVFNNL